MKCLIYSYKYPRGLVGKVWRQLQISRATMLQCSSAVRDVQFRSYLGIYCEINANIPRRENLLSLDYFPYSVIGSGLSSLASLASSHVAEECKRTLGVGVPLVYMVFKTQVCA